MKITKRKQKIFYICISDVIDRVTLKQTPPFRPEVPTEESIPEMDDVMRMCWEEVTLFRPSFDTALESLKKLSNGK